MGAGMDAPPVRLAGQTPVAHAADTPRRNAPLTTRHTDAPDADSKQGPHRPVCLVVAPGRVAREKLTASLEGHGVDCVTAATAAAAKAALRGPARDADTAIIDLGCTKAGSTDAACELVRDLTRERPELAAIVVIADATADDVLRAVHAGAIDVVTAGVIGDALAERVRRAAARAAPWRDRAGSLRRRVDKLRGLARHLNTARHELARQVGTLCTNLATAYRDMADQLATITMASEFNSIVRQELDLESLLRVGLEYMLTKTGPTNAAVFLPSTGGDFSLGAYVNYDCSKDSAEVLMDHMAAAVAPRLEAERSIVLLSSRAELRAKLGEHAEWLGDSSVVAFSCRHDNECLAVVVFFRSTTTPFQQGLLPTLGTLADIFGKQLARIIRVHHRHLPKHKWGSPGDPFGDAGDIDLAA